MAAEGHPPVVKADSAIVALVPVLEMDGAVTQGQRKVPKLIQGSQGRRPDLPAPGKEFGCFGKPAMQLRQEIQLRTRKVLVYNGLLGTE